MINKDHFEVSEVEKLEEKYEFKLIKELQDSRILLQVLVSTRYESEPKEILIKIIKEITIDVESDSTIFLRKGSFTHLYISDILEKSKFYLKIIFIFR